MQILGEKSKSADQRLKAASQLLNKLKDPSMAGGVMLLREDSLHSLVGAVATGPRTTPTRKDLYLAVTAAIGAYILSDLIPLRCVFACVPCRHADTRVPC